MKFDPNVTKTSVVRSHVAAGRMLDALKIAHTFRALGPHARTIKTAYEAYVRPAFYQQIGKDVDQLKADGHQALIALFGEAA